MIPDPLDDRWRAFVKRLRPVIDGTLLGQRAWTTALPDGSRSVKKLFHLASFIWSRRVNLLAGPGRYAGDRSGPSPIACPATGPRRHRCRLREAVGPAPADTSPPLADARVRSPARGDRDPSARCHHSGGTPQFDRLDVPKFTFRRRGSQIHVPMSRFRNPRSTPWFRNRRDRSTDSVP